MPLLGEVTTSVTHVNQELVRVDAITANVQSISGNVSALTSLFAATLGSPIIKVAAFSYGVRSAAGRRHEKDVNRRVREELKGSRRAAVTRRLFYIAIGRGGRRARRAARDPGGAALHAGRACRRRSPARWPA